MSVGVGPQAADDVLERLDRDLGGVKVLEDQDERLAAGDPRQRPGEQLEDLDPVLGLPLLGRDRDARVAARRRAELADLGEQRERDAIRSGARSEKSGRSDAEAAGVARTEVVLDELAEALVGEGPVLLDEAPVEDADLADAGEVLELLEQARLADPGLARRRPRTGTRRRSRRSGGAGARRTPSRGRRTRRSAGRWMHRGSPVEDDRHPELVGREARPVRAGAPRRSGPPSGAAWPGSFSRQRSTMSWSSSRISAPSARGGCGISWTIR